MYKSPIEIICGDIQKQIDNDIYRVTQKYGIKVDENELIQALKYDRDQYNMGHFDGYADAMASIVRCKDCKHYTSSSGCIGIMPGYGFDVKPDDFCSYGERREGE